MDTNRLKQFCTIAETGNLRRAADLLGISHSGLSKSMKVFEHETGIKLFQASGRGIVVTDEGMELYRRSKPFFSELDRLLGRNDESSRSSIRIGSFEVFTSHFIGPLVKDYIPNTEIEIRELIPGRLEEALSLNQVDIGITYDPVARQGIEFFKIATAQMSAYARKNSFAEQTWEEIPFVVPVSPLEGAPSGVKGSDAWPEQKHPRQVRYRVDLLATGLALARQGLCAIYIPDFVARLHNKETPVENRLARIDVPRAVSSVKRDVFIVKRESMQENDITKRIAKAIRQICSGET